MDKLIIKNNWIIEYHKIRTIVKKLCKDYDTSQATYVNIKENWKILISNKYYNIVEQKSNFYYPIFVKLKAVPNYMEKTWEREFQYQIKWKSVYNDKVWNITERKIGEFNYKLLCNIICTRSKLSKWKKDITNECQYCGIEHTVKHLLFECPRVQNFWKLIGSILNVDIKYKHIVIGNIVTNDFIASRNLLFSYLSYGVYKFWILAENGKVRFHVDSLRAFIRKEIFKRSLYVKDKYFKQMVDDILEQL